jgi:hypothetical protein
LSISVSTSRDSAPNWRARLRLKLSSARETPRERIEENWSWVSRAYLDGLELFLEHLGELEDCRFALFGHVEVDSAPKPLDDPVEGLVAELVVVTFFGHDDEARCFQLGVLVHRAVVVESESATATAGT